MKEKRGKRKEERSNLSLRADAEGRLAQTAGASPEMKEKTPEELIHELRVHQIELEMQNEELRKSQLALEETRDKYIDLYDFAPVGYFTFTREALIKEVNLTGAALLGIERKKLINRRFRRFVAPEDLEKWDRYLGSVFVSGQKQSCDLKLRRADESLFYARLESRGPEAAGEGAVVRTGMSDISERKEAEKAQSAISDRYRSYIEVTGQLGWTTNAVGEVVEDSPTWRKYTGLTYEEAKGWGWTKALHPDDLEHTTQTWEKAITAKSTYEAEYRLRRYDGIYRYFLARGIPVLKKDLTIREWVGTCIDVTERKQTEEALRQSREDLSRAQEVGNIGSWRLDVRRNVLTWSDENYRIFGIPKGTPLTYETFLAAVHPEDRTHVDTQWKAGLRGEPYDIEHRLVVDGLVKWVREKAYLEFDEDGSLLGGFGITQDITKRKQAEEELLRLNEELGDLVLARTRLYSVLAKINGAIVRVRDRQVLLEEVCRILVEAGSFRLAWVGILDPESRKIRPVASFGENAYLEGINIIAADAPEGKGPTGRAVYEGHHVINTDFEKDPNLLPWREKARAHNLRSLSAFPLHASRQVIGALTIYSDKPDFFTDEEVGLLVSLTENISFALDSIKSEMLRIAAEDNLRLLNEELETRVRRRTAELEAVNKELEAFSYTVSHDLKSPLRSIQGFARAVSEDYRDCLNDTGKDYLLRINSAGERMTQLIEAMMEISRLTSRELMETPVNLSSIAGMIASELKKIGPDRKVEFLIANEVKAHGDSALIEIVLRNLLDNAFKFTSRQDSAKIEFSVMRMDGKNVYFVRDDGAGFDMRYAGKLFQPFQRFHAEAEFPGIGIGLAIVWKIIVKHGGKIWAESKIGEGATFYFTLE